MPCRDPYDNSKDNGGMFTSLKSQLVVINGDATTMNREWMHGHAAAEGDMGSQNVRTDDPLDAVEKKRQPGNAGDWTLFSIRSSREPACRKKCIQRHL